MKVLIVSDTHRQHGNLEKAIKEAGKIDLLLHLGDVEGGEYFIGQGVEGRTEETPRILR